jgi:histidine ammonia-lyase
MMNSKNTAVFNGQPLTIEDICRIAGQQAHSELSSQTDFIKRINEGALFIDALSKEQGSVYGVTIS